MREFGKRSAVVLAALLIVAVPAAPASAVVHQASPVPGRFCKSADVGAKVKTPKYGVVRCKMVNGRARWVRA